MASDRQRKLDAIITRLQLQYGPRAVRKAAPTSEPIAHLSTTFPELDTALGGAQPRRRITEILGPATSGKVTLAAPTTLGHARGAPRRLSPGSTCRAPATPTTCIAAASISIGCWWSIPHNAADALAITLHLVESHTLATLVFDGTHSTTGARQIPPSSPAAWGAWPPS